MSNDQQVQASRAELTQALETKLRDHLLDGVLKGLEESEVDREMVGAMLEVVRLSRFPLDEPEAEATAARVLDALIGEVAEGAHDHRWT